MANPAGPFAGDGGVCGGATPAVTPSLWCAALWGQRPAEGGGLNSGPCAADPLPPPLDGSRPAIAGRRHHRIGRAAPVPAPQPRRRRRRRRHGPSGVRPAAAGDTPPVPLLV